MKSMQLSFRWYLVWLLSFSIWIVIVAEINNLSSQKEPKYIRCRVCGAKAAAKSDYVEFQDTSKSIGIKPDGLLGDHPGKIHTFVNPSGLEMDIAGFHSSFALEAEGYTKRATFFDEYNWRDLRCKGCNRHIGWKFQHDQLQDCINARIAEVTADLKKKNPAATTATTTTTTNPAVATQAINAQEERTRKENLLAKELMGNCVVALAGWWTYEICFMKEVRQYHQEPDGSRPSAWSMGRYVSSELPPKEILDAIKAKAVVKAAKAAVTAAASNSVAHTANAPIPISNADEAASDVWQYYAGGQKCDENGQLRSTRVRYSCCPKNTSAQASIESIEEPSICSYIIKICVPSLCEDKKSSLTFSGRKSTKTTSSYDKEKLLHECLEEFQKTHGNGNIQPSFYALRWPSVISEGSSELEWARHLQVRS